MTTTREFVPESNEYQLAVSVIPDRGVGCADGHAVIHLCRGYGTDYFHLPLGDATTFALTVVEKPELGPIFADFLEDRCDEFSRYPKRIMAVHVLRLLRGGHRLGLVKWPYEVESRSVYFT